MGTLEQVKGWLRQITEIALLLVALAVVLGVLFAGPEGQTTTIPFVGYAMAGVMNLIETVGSQGLVGLIALGFIVWLLTRQPSTQHHG